MQYPTTTELRQADAWAREQRRVVEQAAQAEEARKKNVEVFTKMWLVLGPDVTKLIGTGHDSELVEARGLAANRWGRLLDAEQQILRDEARIEILARGRVPAHGDDLLPSEVLAKKDAAHKEHVKSARGALKALKEQTQRERAELESFLTKRR
jgi:hypothetical protein